MKLKDNDMAYKPLPVNKYEKYIKMVGWSLEKGKIDWNLYNEHGDFVCSIIIAHGKNTKKEVIAMSVKKTENFFKMGGLTWPPIKNKN